MKKICPKCGRLDDLGDFQGAFCAECAGEAEKEAETKKRKKKAGKKKAKPVLECPRCGKLKLAGEWRQASTLERREAGKTKRRTCFDCALKAGGYHEAVIQVRGDREQAKRLADYLFDELEKKTFVTKVVEQKTGVDLLVGRKRPAIQLVDALHLPKNVTNKLVGYKDGKHLHRMTICVRIEDGEAGRKRSERRLRGE